jgi:vancomycin permeability regulator SanA
MQAMDAILILGAAVWPDGPSPTLRRRTDHAAALWHAGKARLIIPCGGMGQHPPTEAAVMRDLLIASGVPSDRIIEEDQSSTTLENIRNAMRLLGGTDVIIVTDRYHGPRACMVAAHFGLRATVESPAPLRSHLRQHIREAFARPAYALKLRRTPQDFNQS